LRRRATTNDNQIQRKTESMFPPKKKIATTQAPGAIGPYSQAVRTGDLVFTSGQIAIDPATGNLVAGDIRTQTTRVLQNLAAVLKADGLEMADVVKTNVFLKDMADFAAMNEIYATYLAPEGVTPPARSTVEVARLPKDALVEIDLIARASA
jgi:2-iminobutanoate/2-iminopropanoate deaminase